jgi:DnaJ family protein C protein 28
MNSVDQIIRAAMSNGHFEDLPGKGKPLNFEDFPHEDPAMRSAHRLLSAHGFALPWIDERNDISGMIRDLLQAYAHRVGSFGSERHATPPREFHQDIERINHKIRNFNLMAPFDQFQLAPLDVEREWLHVGCQ